MRPWMVMMLLSPKIENAGAFSVTGASRSKWATWNSLASASARALISRAMRWASLSFSSALTTDLVVGIVVDLAIDGLLVAGRFGFGTSTGPGLGSGGMTGF